LVNRHRGDCAAVDRDVHNRADRQVDAVGEHFQTTATIIALAILGSPARRHPVDGCAREGCVEPDVITQDAHKATQRVGGHRSPDDRTYQRRQKYAKPAISVKVT